MNSTTQISNGSTWQTQGTKDSSTMNTTKVKIGTTTYTVPILDSSLAYMTWQDTFENILDYEGLNKFLLKQGMAGAPDLTENRDGTGPTNGIDYKNNKQIKLALYLSTSTINKKYIKKEHNAQETWEVLADLMAQRSSTERLNLKSDLQDIKLDNCISMEDYINKKLEICEKLALAGDKTINDERKVEEIMHGLSNHLEYRSVYHNHNNTSQSVETFAAKLKEEYKVVIKNNLTSESAYQTKQQEQRNLNCFKCKKPGHFKRDCPSNGSSTQSNKKCMYCKKPGHWIQECQAQQKTSRRLTAKQIEGNEVMRLNEAATYIEEWALTLKQEQINIPKYKREKLNDSDLKRNNTWTMDSGATEHFTNDVNELKDVEEISLKISTAKNGADLIATKKGKVYLTENIYLKDVLYIPELNSKLLSLPRITDAGFTINITKENTFIKTKNNQVLLTGTRNGNLYYLDIPEKFIKLREPVKQNEKTETLVVPLALGKVIINKIKKENKKQEEKLVLKQLSLKEEITSKTCFKENFHKESKDKIKEKEGDFNTNYQYTKGKDKKEEATRKNKATKNNKGKINSEIKKQRLTKEIPENQSLNGGEENYNNNNSKTTALNNQDILKEEIKKFGNNNNEPINQYQDNEPVNYQEAISTNEKEQWREAIKEEINSLIKNETFKIEKLTTKPKQIDTKWVFKRKYKSDGDLERYKARCCIRGYLQTDGIDYDSTNITSPVLRTDSFRTLLAIIANKDLEAEQLDIKTAFQIPILDEIIYIKPPEGITLSNIHLKENEYLRLYKSLYGLKQASKMWYNHFRDTLINFGFEQLKRDPCIYRQNEITISIYVDDCIIAAPTTKEIKEIISKLKEIYDLTEQGELKFILGVNITRNRIMKTIKIDQEKYLDNIIKRFQLENSSGLNLPYFDIQPTNELADLKTYQSMAGSNNYASVISRPDITFTNNNLARYLQQPTINHLKGQKKLIRYLKGTKDLKLTINGDLTITAYADASLGDDTETKRSTSGIVIYLGNTPIIWKSKRQPTVALSTTEAELIAACQTCQEILWLKELLNEFKIKINLPIILYQDNKSTIKNIQQQKVNTRMKHLDIKYYFIKELVEEKIIKIDYIPTENNIANICTKGLSTQLHNKFVKKLNLKGSNENNNLKNLKFENFEKIKIQKLGKKDLNNSLDFDQGEVTGNRGDLNQRNTLRDEPEDMEEKGRNLQIKLEETNL